MEVGFTLCFLLLLMRKAYPALLPEPLAFGLALAFPVVLLVLVLYSAWSLVALINARMRRDEVVTLLGPPLETDFIKRQKTDPLYPWDRNAMLFQVWK